MAGEQFSLVWNSFPRNLSSGLYNLLNDEQLVDVTLAVEGKILRAHKLILSVCSTYFKELFKMNSCKHPIVIFKDVNYRDLSAMLHFMYQGEVHVKREDLSSFLKVAETLQIKGLTKDKNEEEDRSIVEEISQRVEDVPNKEQPIALDSTLEDETAMELSEFVANDQRPTTPTIEEEKLPSPLPLETRESTNLEQESFSPTSNEQSSHNVPSDEPNTESEVDGEERRESRLISNRRPEECPENIETTVDEPLDYTSDIGRLSRTKNEPPDYTDDMNFDVECNNGYEKRENPDDNEDCNLQKEDDHAENDCLPNSEFLTYNPNNENEPSQALDHLEASFGPGRPCDNGIYNRRRRAMKGISGGRLPLETTLRVISELRPTLRMERGKVIRMYSCPWCLRHFTRKENLKLHVRYIHGPLENLTCKVCGNKYKNSNSLRVHSYLYHNAKRTKHSKP